MAIIKDRATIVAALVCGMAAITALTQNAPAPEADLAPAFFTPESARRRPQRPVQRLKMVDRYLT